MNHEELIHLDLFSGIGGASLAADWVWPNVKHIFCEIDPFCQQVLKKHWPEAEIWGDIRTLANTPGVFSNGGDNHTRVGKQPQEVSESGNDSGPGVFLLTGGFPCQPFSQAGRRKGTADDRHLWPEMLRVIREFRPRWVVGENVAGLVTWNDGMVLREVLSDLEVEGYEVQAFIIPACAVNAPHRRDRVWIVAHSEGVGSGRRPQEIREADGGQERELHTEPNRADKDASHSKHRRCKQKSGEPSVSPTTNRQETDSSGRNHSWSRDWPEVATELCRVDDGLPVELDGLELSKSQHRVQRLKGLGNAWVPQVAVQIFSAIKQTEETAMK